MKLKTLEEIDCDFENYKQVLRQEAIKHIEEFERELHPLPKIEVFGQKHSVFRRPNKPNTIIFEEEEFQLSNTELNKFRKMLIAYIKYFNNITEGGLK